MHPDRPSIPIGAGASNWVRDAQGVVLVVGGFPDAVWCARVERCVERLGSLCPAVTQVCVLPRDDATNLAAPLRACVVVRWAWPTATVRARFGSVDGPSFYPWEPTGEVADIRYIYIESTSIDGLPATDADIHRFVRVAPGHELRVAVKGLESKYPAYAAWVPFPGVRYVAGIHSCKLAVVCVDRGRAVEAAAEDRALLRLRALFAVRPQGARTYHREPVAADAGAGACAAVVGRVLGWLDNGQQTFAFRAVSEVPAAAPDGTIAVCLEDNQSGKYSLVAVPDPCGVRLVAQVFPPRMPHDPSRWMLEQNATLGVGGAWCVDPATEAPCFRSELLAAGSGRIIELPGGEELFALFAPTFMCAAAEVALALAPVLVDVGTAMRVTG